MLSTSQGFAAQPDVGDQPGLIPDDTVELEPEFQKTMVLYRTTEAPGTIIIQTAERHLYVVQPGGRAIRYGIGVEAATVFTWQGLLKITRKAEWPDWTPPPENDRATALSAALHGRRRPATRSAPALCISAPPSTASTAPTGPTPSAPPCRPAVSRLVNSDVADLYDRIPVGTKVIVRQKPEL